MQGAAVSSGQQGLDVIRESIKYKLKIDAIILDYHMPEMNGAQVARAIKSDPALKKIPIVMLILQWILMRLTDH